jgi:hypothetical protein
MIESLKIKNAEIEKDLHHQRQTVERFLESKHRMTGRFKTYSMNRACSSQVGPRRWKVGFIDKIARTEAVSKDIGCQNFNLQQRF